MHAHSYVYGRFHTLNTNSYVCSYVYVALSALDLEKMTLANVTAFLVSAAVVIAAEVNR